MLIGRRLAILIIAALLGEREATPQGGGPASLPSNLVNTRWRLVEFKSMDDAGSKRPADRSQYTMHLGADGAVSMKLNCNSANGDWSATASAEKTTGRFQFGPLAMTRALCPPPSLDEHIAAQAQSVRSFLIRDGRLYLSLMADGGIYEWEPLPEGSQTLTADAALEAAILRAEPSYTRAAVGSDSSPKGRYVYARADLNGDGKDEVIVYLLGPPFCGTGGCELLIFRDAPRGYRLVSSLAISRPPVIASPTRTKGWNDIWRRESGGGAPSSFVNHVFNGRRYVRKGNVPGDKPPEGRTLIGPGVTYENALPLEPKR